MQDNLLKIGKYKITPYSSISMFEERDFNIIKADCYLTILVSKKPLKWFSKNFYVTIFGKQGKIRKIELSNAKRKYSMRYETMNDTILKELQKENTIFLEKCLGIPNEKNITGIKYHYEWGEIFSFYDNRSCQVGIVIAFT